MKRADPVILPLKTDFMKWGGGYNDQLLSLSWKIVWKRSGRVYRISFPGGIQMEEREEENRN